MGLWSRRALTQAEGIQHQKIIACGFSLVLSNEESRSMPDQCPGLGGCEEEAGVCARGNNQWNLPTCPASRGDLVGPWAGWSKWLWRCWAVHTVVYKCGAESHSLTVGVEDSCCSEALGFWNWDMRPSASGEGPWSQEGPHWGCAAGRLALPWELWLEDVSWWPAQHVPNCAQGLNGLFHLLGFYTSGKTIRVGSIHWTQATSIFCSRQYHWFLVNL